MTRQLDDLIEGMSDPSIYPHKPHSIQVVHTHISVVFIAGDFVYKVKKPVNFGFLDFSTLERRRFFCRQEVTLNSRFSEGIYLGVASIYQGPKGMNLIGEGSEIDVAVLMKYVPEKYLMASMLEKERIGPELLDRISDRLAYFHSQGQRGGIIDSFGSVEVIQQNLKENFDQTKAYVGRTIDSHIHQEISSLSFAFLRTNADLFRERVKQGYIRDCHGDLHLDHVIILDQIMLYDCIEFNDRFRYSDTAADLAFLLMDLDFRGWPHFEERLSQRYALASHDAGALKLLGFYKSYRAFIRGKVWGFTLDEPEVSPSDKEAATSRARDYFRLALAFLKSARRPALIIMTGLMGSGKSFLARKLGIRLGVEPISSDVIRKGILGIPKEEHRLDKFGQGIYRPNATEGTYRALLDRALDRLKRGESAILDASFMRYVDRMSARKLAEETQATFRLVECVCPDDIIRLRLENRILESGEPSDGRWELISLQKSAFDEIRENEREYYRKWDSTTSAGAFLKSLVIDLVCAR